MNIDLKQLEALLKVLEERNIWEFEFEAEGTRVHLKRGAMATSHSAVAPFAGTIVECLAETGNPVEFGQKLFKVKKA